MRNCCVANRFCFNATCAPRNRPSPVSTLGPDDAAARRRAEPAVLPAAGPAALRELHGRQPAPAAAAAAARLPTSTPTAAGPTTWPTRPATRSEPWPCWTGGKRSFASAIDGRAHPSGVHRPGGNHPRVQHPHRSVPRSAGGVPAGPAGNALRNDRARCWNTAATRPIRWAGWCSIWAGAIRPSGRGWPIRSARACNWPISARTWRATGTAAAIYLPQAACRRFGYDEAEFARRECNDAFRQLLAAQVDQAEGWLRAGLPLAAKMPAGLRLPVALFAAGGLATLEAIRRQHYDVWTRRPTDRRTGKLRLAVVGGSCGWEEVRRGLAIGK